VDSADDDARSQGSIVGPRADRVSNADRTTEALLTLLSKQQKTIEELRNQASELRRVVEILAPHAVLEGKPVDRFARDLIELSRTTAWKIALRLRREQARWAPRGSWRGRVLQLGVRGVLVLKRDGLVSLLRRAAQKVTRRLSRPAPSVSTGEPQPVVPSISAPALPPPINPYDAWLANNSWNAQAREFAAQGLRQLPRKPLLSVIIPVYNVADCWLEKAVASVQAQVYPYWEICLVDDGSTLPTVRPLLLRLAAQDGRTKLHRLPRNSNISAASNAAVALARGEYLVFLDQDDELAPDCLLQLARAAGADPAPDLIYSDDDKIDADGRRHSPQFKPDWSPELLLSYMYFSHAFCVRRALFHEVGGFREGFEGCQDYDLALRLTERSKRVVHIPKVLYHWRTLPSSTASSGAAKSEAFPRGARAVQDTLDRRGITGWVTRPEFAVRGDLGLFQIDFPEEGPAVTIILEARSELDILRACVRSILDKTAYRNYRVLMIAPGRDDPATEDFFASLSSSCRVVRRASEATDPNAAQLKNWAVSQVDTEYVLFLDDDTEVRRPEWLSQLVGYAQIPGVGVVGGRLLSPDGTVQHAGMLTGFFEGMPAHAFRALPWWHNGYLFYASAARNYSAVCAACLLVRRDRFVAFGGFDEERFGGAFYDVDFCLRLREAGLRAVYTPRAELIHHESAVRDRWSNPAAATAFRRLWGSDEDPYYNRSLSTQNPRFEIGVRRATGQVAPGQMPIRVLLCSHNLHLEGAPWYLHALAVGLKARGRVVPEVCAPSDGPLAAFYREAGIPVHPVWFYGAEPDPCVRQTGAVEAFAQWIHERHYAVVLANTLVQVDAVNAAERAGVPSLWALHESVDVRPFIAETLGAHAVATTLAAFSKPYQVIFVSHATRTLFAPLETHHNFNVIHVGLKRQSIAQVIATMSPDEARARIGCPSDKVVITIVGTVSPRKAQMDFARAAIEILSGRRDVVFYIVGCRPSPYVDALQNLVCDHADDIRLVPETPDVHLYYRASDIFVCCSSVESYPAVILEAMAFKLAIVTTPVFGIAEQVRHGHSALTFEPGDLRALVEHLAYLLNYPSERHRLAIGAAATLETLISHEEMIERFETLIIEAYAAGARPAEEPACAAHRQSA
jgi:GT2 family glycosyltransferase/glycosyltransferase involved in cell wall biosynthesis